MEGPNATQGIARCKRARIQGTANPSPYLVGGTGIVGRRSSRRWRHRDRSGLIQQSDADILVASLTNRSLHRLHREEGRFVYSEPIMIGWRIRDLIELSDGRLVLWADGGRLVILTSADHEEGLGGG